MHDKSVISIGGLAFFSIGNFVTLSRVWFGFLIDTGNAYLFRFAYTYVYQLYMYSWQYGGLRLIVSEMRKLLKCFD